MNLEESLNTSRLISEKMMTHFQKSLGTWQKEKIEICINEFAKFAMLASEKENMFLPCSLEIDAIWHTFILETREYFSFCNRIKPGFYLHHHGITFEDHSRPKSLSELTDDDLSIIASYISNFGPYSAKAIEHWPVAQNVSESFFNSLEAFNSYFSSLLKIHERIQRK